MRTDNLGDAAERVISSLQALSLTDFEALTLSIAELNLLDNDTQPTHKMPLQNGAKPRRRRHVPGQHRHVRPCHFALALQGGGKCNPG
jgi:hypothetical protein